VDPPTGPVEGNVKLTVQGKNFPNKTSSLFKVHSVQCVEKEGSYHIH
jgi:hypothetical protein